MDLEEHTPELDPPGASCEVCGASLTAEEQRAAMESGGPALCTVHAIEASPALDEDEDFDGE